MLLATPALRPRGEPTLLLHRELPALVLVARYVRFLVERVARQILCPARHRGLVGLPRAEVARGVELRRIGGAVGVGVAYLGVYLGSGSVRVELHQLEGRTVYGGFHHLLREGRRHVDCGGNFDFLGARDGAYDRGWCGVGERRTVRVAANAAAEARGCRAVLGNEPPIVARRVQR